MSRLKSWSEMEEDMVPILAVLSTEGDVNDEITELIGEFVGESAAMAITFLVLMTQRCADLIRVDGNVPADRVVRIGGFLKIGGDEQDPTEKASMTMLAHIIEHHMNNEWDGVMKHILEAGTGGEDFIFPLIMAATLMYRKIALQHGAIIKLEDEDHDHMNPFEFFKKNFGK